MADDPTPMANRIHAAAVALCVFLLVVAGGLACVVILVTIASLIAAL